MLDDTKEETKELHLAPILDTRNIINTNYFEKLCISLSSSITCGTAVATVIAVPRRQVSTFKDFRDDKQSESEEWNVWFDNEKVESAKFLVNRVKNWTLSTKWYFCELPLSICFVIGITSRDFQTIASFLPCHWSWRSIPLTIGIRGNVGLCGQ